MATSEMLSIDSIGNLDEGYVRETINTALAQAVLDCDNRGDDGKQRHVMIKISFLKEPERDHVIVSVKAKAVLPELRSANVVAAVKKDGRNKAFLQFESMSPERPDQPAFDVFSNKVKKEEVESDDS